MACTCGKSNITDRLKHATYCDERDGTGSFINPGAGQIGMDLGGELGIGLGGGVSMDFDGDLNIGGISITGD